MSLPSPQMFGRFELRSQLGRSSASQVWLALDPQGLQEVILCLPRAQPLTPAELELWLHDVRMAARLSHPGLAPVLDVGLSDGWPYAVFARGDDITLAERLKAGPALTPQEAATLIADALEGLAYAHDAGLVHQDVNAHSVLVTPNGRGRLLGVGVGVAATPPGQPRRAKLDVQGLRLACERDVLMMGLLLHYALGHTPPLGESDLQLVANRVGQEIIRLPWSAPHPIPDTLRAIANRATDRQYRQRYLNARTLLSALQRWVKASSEESGGALSVLLERFNEAGALPARQGAERALMASLSRETLKVDDLVEVVLKNPAMAWEMLRSVNAAAYQAGDGEAVTTLSRAIMMLGQEGIRRVSSGVKPWPGEPAVGAPARTSEQQASTEILANELRHLCIAGHVARLLSPFGIKDEEAALAAMAQCMGTSLIAYHFPDEAAQIKSLSRPAPPAVLGEKPQAGMAPEAAMSAVMGVSMTDLTASVLKHWGLDERLILAARPLSLDTAVRKPANADETLRVVASIAQELASTVFMELDQATSAVHQIYTRYARALNLTPKDCAQSLERAIRMVDGQTAPVRKISRP